MAAFKHYILLVTILCYGGCLLVPDSAYAVVFAIINNNPVADQSFRLLSSTPYDREIVTAPPESVSITFSQPPSPEKSFIKVFDMYGTRLDDGTLNDSGVKLSVMLPELVPGKYLVKWGAHCRCNDDTDLRDSYHFTVR